MAKRHLRLVAPATVNRTVRPRRPPHRLGPCPLDHAGEPAVPSGAPRSDTKMKADLGFCSRCTYRHGLRASELVDPRWDQVDSAKATLHVRRVKQGTPATHPILGDELRSLRRLQREQKPKSAFIFVSERGAPLSTAGFARMVERAGAAAKLAFKAHPHMLRHACGYALANKGHDTRALQAYLGHRNIQHTVRYTELSPTRFKDFWRD